MSATHKNFCFNLFSSKMKVTIQVLKLDPVQLHGVVVLAISCLEVNFWVQFTTGVTPVSPSSPDMNICLGQTFLLWFLVSFGIL